MSAVSVLLAPSDEAFGERIAGALARRGLSARLITGDQADMFIDNDLGDATSIVVWSAAAMRLAQLHDQARTALENGALIPVAIDGATAPEGFENLPPIDLSEWRGDDENPRWRFVLEALAIASEYRQGADHSPASVEQPGTKTGTDKNAKPDTQVALLRSVNAPIIDPPMVSTPFLATETVGGRLPRLPVTRKATQRQPAKSKARRFDPDAVAVAGVMILCLATGAAIILAPSFLPSSAPTSEAPATTPAPETPRIELAMLQPVLTPAATNFDADDDLGAFQSPPPTDNFVTAQQGGDIHSYEPDGLEGYGEGDISYPEDEARVPTPRQPVDSHADEIHLAMLGPAVPLDDVIAPLNDVSELGATPLAPSIKPGVRPQAASSASIDRLLVNVPELTDHGATASSVDGSIPAAAGGYFRDCTACPDLVAIPAGVFMMGPGSGERSRPNEGPATHIELARPFAIATREVTFAEWDACVAEDGCAGHKAHDFGWGRGDQPVVGVSFADAQNYAAWLSDKTGHTYRLPSEAEWEYAARAGQSTLFSFGDDLSAKQANYDGRFVYRGQKSRWIGRPTSASRYPANAFGLFDMHGNVWEWTADCWRMSLAGAPADGSPRGGTCVTRVLKGGAFNTGGWRLRAAHRIGKPASTREMEIGFRVVRALD